MLDMSEYSPGSGIHLNFVLQRYSYIMINNDNNRSLKKPLNILRHNETAHVDMSEYARALAIAVKLDR